LNYLISEKIKNLSLSVPDENFRMQVWHNNQLKSVKIHDHFVVLKEKGCKEAFILDTEEEPDDAHNILSNGSVHYTELDQVHGPETYCIANNVNFKNIRLLFSTYFFLTSISHIQF